MERKRENNNKGLKNGPKQKRIYKKERIFVFFYEHKNIIDRNVMAVFLLKKNETILFGSWVLGFFFTWFLIRFLKYILKIRCVCDVAYVYFYFNFATLLHFIWFSFTWLVYRTVCIHDVPMCVVSKRFQSMMFVSRIDGCFNYCFCRKYYLMSSYAMKSFAKRARALCKMRDKVTQCGIHRKKQAIRINDL